jgi:hypothetical protein
MKEYKGKEKRKIREEEEEMKRREQEEREKTPKVAARQAPAIPDPTMTTSYYDVSTQLRGKETRERRLGDSRSRCTCVVSVDAILRTDLFRLCPRVHSLKYIVYCCMSLLTCRGQYKATAT